MGETSPVVARGLLVQLDDDGDDDTRYALYESLLIGR
jgi:hypothetical protein